MCDSGGERDHSASASDVHASPTSLNRTVAGGNGIPRAHTAYGSARNPVGYRTMSWKSAILGGCLACAGCTQHISIGAVPPRSAPFAVRAAAWERLRPTGVGYTDTVGVRGGVMLSGGTFVTREFDRVVLANDVEVRAADDLLPALEPGSPEADAASRAGRLLTAREVLEYGGTSLLLASVVAIPVLYGAASDTTTTARGLEALLGTAGAGLLGLLIGAIVVRPLARNVRQQAFESYRAGLDRRLGVCVGPHGLSECAASPPPAVTTSRGIP